jgi:hypothetical protein
MANGLVGTPGKVVRREVCVERVTRGEVGGEVVRRVVFVPCVEKSIRSFLWDNPELRRCFREAKEREEREREARRRLRG